jgi:hypothetical protein
MGIIMGNVGENRNNADENRIRYFLNTDLHIDGFLVLCVLWFGKKEFRAFHDRLHTGLQEFKEIIEEHCRYSNVLCLRHNLFIYL